MTKNIILMKNCISQIEFFAGMIIDQKINLIGILFGLRLDENIYGPSMKRVKWRLYLYFVFYCRNY